jgi:tetrahydromethanopterin S-methyltransferase subunit D
VEAAAAGVGVGTVQRGWLPTRKWLAGLITGLLTIVGHAVATSAWDKAEWAEVLTLASSLAVAYLVPNAPTPGGAPDATPKMG